MKIYANKLYRQSSVPRLKHNTKRNIILYVYNGKNRLLCSNQKSSLLVAPIVEHIAQYLGTIHQKVSRRFFTVYGDQKQKDDGGAGG